MAEIVSAAPVSVGEINVHATKPAKSSQKVEKGKERTLKASEQRLGIRDPTIGKKHGSLHKADVKFPLSKSCESLATTDPMKGAALALGSCASEVDIKSLVTAATQSGDSGKVESDCLDRSPGGNSVSAYSPAREGAADAREKDEAITDNVENCDITAWPDFSLDSFDGGEVDELDVAGSLILPELEEMSQKDQSQTEPEASADTRPSETSSKSVQQSEQYESSFKSGSKSTGKKKAKVDWTPELHRRFVQAVEQLGVEKAIPSRILELMGVKCLTRHNIASHLQKYRSHRRHLAAREAEAAGWHGRKPAEGMVWPAQATTQAPTTWAYPNAAPALSGAQPNPPMIQPRPVVGVPPYQQYQMPHQMTQQMTQSHMTMTHHQSTMAATPAPTIGMPMHVWGHPTVDHSRSHMWQQPQHQAAPSPYPPPAWFAPDGSVWHYAGVQAPSPAMDAWGQPTSMVSGTPCYPHQQQAPALSYPMYPQAQGVVCGAPVCGPQGMTHGAVSGMPSSVGVPAHHTQAPVAMGAAVAVASPMGDTMGGMMVPAAQPSEAVVIADEAMPNPMFPLPDDITLDFAAISASLGDDLIEANDILDAAISEALTNPSTPMPLGLKPPSVDGVLEELNRQGITMPPEEQNKQGISMQGISMPPATPEALDALPAAEVAAVASELEAILEP